MKKSILIFVVFFSLALAFSASAAEEQGAPVWTAEITPICQGVCLEGGQAVWQVQIKNVGTVPFDLQQLGLIDSDGILFAFNDLTSQKATISPNQVGTVNIQGVIPPPTRGSTLYYKLNYVVGNNVYPDGNFRKMLVLPISDVECTDDAYCDNGEKCAAYRCTPYSLFNSSEVPKPDQKMSSEQVNTLLLVSVVVLLVVLLLVLIFNRHKK